jgi:TRAP-type C4-dicarboxylate transport system permease small subunit
MKLAKLINSGIPILCGTLLVGIVSMTFMQIVIREIFNSSLPWSDEVSQFCLTWLVLFGSIWALKNNQHLNVGIKLHQKLNGWKVCLIDSILALVIVGCATVAAYQTAIFCLQQWARESMSLRWLNMGWVFIALPLAVLALCYYYLKSFFKNLICIFKKDEPF